MEQPEIDSGLNPQTRKSSKAAKASLILAGLSALVFVFFFTRIVSISQSWDMAIMIFSLVMILVFLRLSKRLRLAPPKLEGRNRMLF